MFRVIITCAVSLIAHQGLSAELPQFGDNASQWANDGECDDRRFFGQGMADNLNNDDISHDATDCKKLFDVSKIQVWYEAKARAATQCSKIDFGDNSSEWVNDGECDDPRFEGRGSSDDILKEDTKKDANDCRKMCSSGVLFIRNY